MPILFLIIFLGSCNLGREAEIQVYPQLGHSHIVNTALFSDNGRYIVSASWDMSVKLWDVGTGRELATMIGHTGVVDSAAVSRDGRLIASASRDGTVRIWDAGTGKEKIKLEEKAFSVAFSADNKSVFTLSFDGIKQWNIRTGKFVILTEEHCALAAFSPDAQYAAYGADKLEIWNVKTGNNIIVKNNLTLISAMAVGNEGKYIALGGRDGSVNLTDTENGSDKKLPVHSEAVTAMAFSSDNRYLVTADRGGEMFLFDLLNIASYKSFSGHNGDINSLSFSTDTRYLISASSDKTVKMWNVTDAEEVLTLGGHPCPPELTVISHDNRYIATLNAAKGVKIWNAKTGELIETIGAYGPISSMVFSPDNENLVTVAPDGVVSNVNIKTGRIKRLSQDNGASAALIRSINMGNKIVSALWDGSIEIWDYLTDEKKHLANEDGILNAVALDNAGKYLAAGFFNGKLRVTDTETGNTTVLLQYKSPVDSVGFDTGGMRLVCGLRDGSVHLLDISAGKDAVPPMRHLSGVSSAAFSDDGRYVISGSSDNTAILWDAATGKKIASFISFDDDEWIVITPDGYYNASPRGDERLNARIGTEVYGMDQFSAIFFQAEAVRDRLEGLPDTAVTSTANRRITAPPAIYIDAPRESGTDTALIDILIKDKFLPLHGVQIVINGRLLGRDELDKFYGEKKLFAEKTSLVVKENAYELKFSIPVALEAGSNRVEIIAANREKGSAAGGNVAAVGRKSVYIVNTSATDAHPADLWVLAIGSNGSLNGGNNLKYAVNSAKGIQALFESQKGKRYRNVYTKLIADDEKITPTRENIIGNIRVFFDKANAYDVLVLYLSGHGEERKRNSGYYFLPQSVSLDDIGIISEMPGRKLIFIDSCFSGGVDDKGLARNLKNQSTVIITSSQKDEISRDGTTAVPYGLFTEALITGINGEAAANNEVRIFNLGEYVYGKVMLLSGGTQHPYVYAPEGFYGFVVAVSSEQ